MEEKTYMTQEEIREKISRWHNDYLASYSKIAYLVGVSPQFIKMFVNGNRRLGDKNKEILEKIIGELKL